MSAIRIPWYCTTYRPANRGTEGAGWNDRLALSWRSLPAAYAEREPGLWSPSAVGRSDRLSTSARISLSGYRRWPPRVRTKGSLPSLAQRDTVFGDTWSSAAACDAVRCFGSLDFGWRIGLPRLRSWSGSGPTLARPSVCSAGPCSTLTATSGRPGGRHG